MLIFAEQVSSRLRYAASVLLEPLGLFVQFTSDENEFTQSAECRLNYSLRNLNDSIQIIPNDWLRDGENQLVNPEIGDWNGVPTLFHQGKGTVPFDLFSAIFYLVSRFEEYHSFEGDAMKRFEFADSFTGKHGLHHRPLIDEWREQLIPLLSKFSSQEKIVRTPGKNLLTIDIDSAFAYQHKGVYRTIGGFVKDLIHADFRNMKMRWKVLIRTSPDPYNTYDYILRTCQTVGISPRWFFLLADFGTYDKNVPHTSKELRHLIQLLDSTGTVGIHPGVASNDSDAVLSKEVNRLVEIMRRPVLNSRQHYLKLEFPATYRKLLRSGIRRDYTMGYSSDTGFRLGTSREIKWYDVEHDEVTELSLIPFCVMDTTLRKYLKLDPVKASERLRELHHVITSSHGQFVVLWHNEALSEDEVWKSWRVVFEEAVRLVARTETTK